LIEQVLLANAHRTGSLPCTAGIVVWPGECQIAFAVLEIRGSWKPVSQERRWLPQI